MPAFRFNLQAVLKQRLAVEREKQRALGELERLRLGLEDRLREFQRAIVAEKADLRHALAPGSSSGVREVRLQANMSLALVGKAQQTVLQLAAIMRRIELARRDLLEATTRRKAVERLRERRFEQWRADQNAAEARSLDELAVMAAARRMEDAP